jgi:phage-related minor tail protein
VNVQALPRTVINTYLSMARVPFKAVAKASGQQGNEQWPPALAFDGFEASVQSVLGSLLRDDRLLERGRLGQAKVAQLRKAAELEAVAQAERDAARQEFTERRDDAETKRQEAAQRAVQREREVEQQAQQRKREADNKAATQAAAARQTKAAQDKAIDRRGRVATTQALTEEAEALKARQQALDAAETVDVIDDTIEGTKAARKSG